METGDVIVVTDDSDDQRQGTLQLLELNGTFYLSLVSAREKTTLEKAVSAAWPATRMAGRFALTLAKGALSVALPPVAKYHTFGKMNEDWEEAKKAWQGQSYDTLFSVSFGADDVFFDDDIGFMIVVKRVNGKEQDIGVTPNCSGGEEGQILGRWKAFIEGEN